MKANLIILVCLIMGLMLNMVPLHGMSDQERKELIDYSNYVPANIGDAKNYDMPRRELSIIVTDHGYYPDQISVFEGEQVKFFLTSTVKEKGCFIMNTHNVFLSAQKGQVTEGEATFKKAGRYRFYCPTGSMKGHITVLQRKSEQDRKIASVKAEQGKRDTWMPRDH